METTVLDQYGPRVIDVSASNDGSLTKADITAFTPKQVVDLKDVAVAEAEMYRQLTVSRVTGVKELPLLDLLLSRMTNIQPEFREDGPKGQTFFRPYILRKQEDVVNANMFSIVAGEADPNAGQTVNGVEHPSHAWQITVSSKALGAAANAKLAYQETGIEDVGRYFLPGQTVVVFNKDGGGNVNEPLFRIISSTSRVAGNGVEVADVTIVPNRSEAWWDDGDNAGLLAGWQVTDGLVMIGTNSVSDYESWAENEPVDHSVRMVAHWIQRCRFTRCYDDLYRKYLDKIMKGDVNTYLQVFKELPMAEQNRKMYAIYQKKLLTSMLFGQAINEHQTVEGYKNLPNVLDPRNNNGLIEYKANALGLFTQLLAADRRQDSAGAAFDMNVFEEQVYGLKRHREVNGGSVDSIDFITDKGTANRFKWVMADYYKKRYGMSWSREFGAKGKIEFGKQTMWNYNTYELEDAQCEINIITEPFLADYRAAFGSGSLGSRGNIMAAIDWQDVELGMGEFSRRTSKSPDIETDPDFRHTIKANIGYCEMESAQLAPIVGDPKRHLVLENFSNDVPTKTFPAASATEV